MPFEELVDFPVWRFWIETDNSTVIWGESGHIGWNGKAFLASLLYNIQFLDIFNRFRIEQTQINKNSATIAEIQIIKWYKTCSLYLDCSPDSAQMRVYYIYERLQTFLKYLL